MELTAGGVGPGARTADVPPRVLQVAEDAVALNGATVAREALAEAMTREAEQPVIVSLQDGVTAQRLTDLLVVLRGVPGLQITLLGQG